MASVIFESAARIIAQVLEWLQTSNQDQISNLITDTFSYGIDNATSSGEGFFIVPGTNNTTVNPSVNCTLESIAYDPTGARIFISASDTTLYNPANVTATTNDGLGNFVSTPQSTGVINIPVTQSSQNYIWVNYLATIDTTAFTLNAETRAKIFYKQTDGYNIQVTTVNTPPNANSIFLASVNMTGAPAPVASSNISQVGRTYYNILPKLVPITTALNNGSNRTPSYTQNTTYTLDAHIKAVGTGTGISPTNPHNMSLADLGVGQFDTVQEHRILEHGNAILAGVPGTPYPTLSALAPSIMTVSPGSDTILIQPLLFNPTAIPLVEFAIVNGTAYGVNNAPTLAAEATVLFPSTSGTYNVYWDSNAQVFGVTTNDISNTNSLLWICTVTYTFVGTGPLDHNALSGLIDRRRVGSTTHLLQRWTNNSRPGDGSLQPLAGEAGFNLTSGMFEYWNGSAWVQSLATTAVDNTTINLNGSNQLEVKPNGITATQIANNTITGTQVANGSIGNTQISGALGVWSSAGTADSVSRLAATDLWITGHGTGGGTNPTIIILTDSSNPPTTERAHGDGPSGLNVTVSCMVRKGDYWKVEQANCVNTYVYSIPIGS